MKWKRISSAEESRVAVRACLSKDALVFRGTHYLFRWIMITGKTKWLTELANDRPIGEKLLTCTLDSVISFADLGPKSGSVFYCVDSKKGAIKWKREYSFLPEPQGLVASDDKIIVQAYDILSEEFCLYVLDANSGEILASIPSIDARNILLLQDEIFVATNWGIYSSKHKGTELQGFRSGKTTVMTSKSQYLYFQLLSDKYYTDNCVICWDSKKSKEVGKICRQAELSDLWPSPLGNTLRCAVRVKESGRLELLDFQKGDLLWEANISESYKVKECTWTPYGLICLLYNQDYEGEIVLISEKSGEILSKLQISYSPMFIFWYEQCLLVSSLAKGLESFELVPHL